MAVAGNTLVADSLATTGTSPGLLAMLAGCQQTQLILMAGKARLATSSGESACDLISPLVHRITEPEPILSGFRHTCPGSMLAGAVKAQASGWLPGVLQQLPQMPWPSAAIAA